MTVKWDLGSKGSEIDLSTDQLTATHKAGYADAAVRGDAAIIGKKVFKVQVTQANEVKVGVTNGVAAGTAGPDKDYPNALGQTNAAAWAIPGISAGDTLLVAVDTTTKKLWMKKTTDSAWNSSQTGTQNPGNAEGGIDISVISQVNSAAVYYPLFYARAPGDAAILNASPSSNEIPSGFSALEGGGTQTPPSSATEFVTPKDHGGVGYCKFMFEVTRTNASSTITKVNNPALGYRDAGFTAEDVGKTICWLDRVEHVIATVVSATQATLTAPASSSRTDRAIVYVDDTAAVTAAIAAAKSARKPLLLDTRYVTGPQQLPDVFTIQGLGLETGLVLKPGSATVSKYLLGHSSTTPYLQTIKDMSLIGLKDFHNAGYETQGVRYVGSTDTPIVDTYNRYLNLYISEFGTGLIYSNGKGESKFDQISIDRCVYGFDINAFDNSFTGCNATADGVAWRLGSTASSNRFAACKGYYAGGSPMPGDTAGAASHCCWSLNGASFNEFVGCEGQESWADVWVFNDAKYNVFYGCRAADPGCISLNADHQYGGPSASGEIRAGLRILGATEGNFFGFSVGARVHGQTNYGTHAVHWAGNGSYNSGIITIDKDLTPWATAKVSYTSTGSANHVLVDSVRIDGGKRVLTGSHTLVYTDLQTTLEMNVATANTLTVPPESSVPFDIGTRIEVVQVGAGQTSIVAGAGVTIQSNGNKLKLAGQFASATLTKRAADTWVLTGNLVV